MINDARRGKGSVESGEWRVESGELVETVEMFRVDVINKP